MTRCRRLVKTPPCPGSNTSTRTKIDFPTLCFRRLYRPFLNLVKISRTELPLTERRWSKRRFLNVFRYLHLESIFTLYVHILRCCQPCQYQTYFTRITPYLF